MKVRQVGIRPSQESCSQNCTSMPPEMLAATLARFSRNDEGFDDIISKIEFGNETDTLQKLVSVGKAEATQEFGPMDTSPFLEALEELRYPDFDKSVDNIFRMVDYGHQSIADMVPVCLVVDCLSIFMTYILWTLVHQGSGQEKSTRYCRFSAEGLYCPPGLQNDSDWAAKMQLAFDSYEQALTIWTKIVTERPDLAGVTEAQLKSSDSKIRKAAERIVRNYPFDRARYFIPVAAVTNVGIIMSAREWCSVIRDLESMVWAEAKELAGRLRLNLEIVSPRMIRHSFVTPASIDLANQEFADNVSEANAVVDAYSDWDWDCSDSDRAEPVELQVFEPCLDYRTDYISPKTQRIKDLQNHKVRYDRIGKFLSRTSVAFWVPSVSMAELRDMNRHRTGSKECLMVPLGFYYAQNQVPEGFEEAGLQLDRLANEVGTKTLQTALYQLQDQYVEYPYWTLLGHQYDFYQTVQADKFIYMVELRTGKGTHFRYAKHYRELAEAFFKLYPEIRQYVVLGEGEPE